MLCNTIHYLTLQSCLIIGESKTEQIYHIFKFKQLKYTHDFAISYHKMCVNCKTMSENILIKLLHDSLFVSSML